MDVILREPALTSTRDVVLWAPTDPGGGAGASYDRTAADQLIAITSAHRTLTAARRGELQVEVPQEWATRALGGARRATEVEDVIGAAVNRLLTAQRIAEAALPVDAVVRREVAYRRETNGDLTVIVTTTPLVTYGRTSPVQLAAPAPAATRATATSRTASQPVALVGHAAARAATYVRRVVHTATVPVAAATYTQERIFFREATETVVEQVAQAARQLLVQARASTSMATPGSVATRVVAFERASSASSAVSSAAARGASVLRTGVVGVALPAADALFRHLTNRRPLVLTVQALRRAKLVAQTPRQ